MLAIYIAIYIDGLKRVPSKSLDPMSQYAIDTMTPLNAYRDHKLLSNRLVSFYNLVHAIFLECLVLSQQQIYDLLYLYDASSNQKIKEKGDGWRREKEKEKETEMVAITRTILSLSVVTESGPVVTGSGVHLVVNGFGIPSPVYEKNRTVGHIISTCLASSNLSMKFN
ncbi:uncharacterized protein [Typha angustifolia]|uniref:uncharacterized protein n=1 Tax=Typha angustifolia TaxID=59011 RepID=UPI003C2F33BC